MRPTVATSGECSPCATGGARQALVTDALRGTRADPEGLAHDDAGRDNGNIRIWPRVGQSRPRHCPGIELRDDITAMATRQDWVVDDRKSRTPASRFVIHSARGDE